MAFNNENTPLFESFYLEDLEKNFTPILDFDFSNNSLSSNNGNSNTNNETKNFNLGKIGSLRHIPSLDTKFSIMGNDDQLSNLLLEEEKGSEILDEKKGPIVVKSEIEEPISIPNLKPSVSLRSLLSVEPKLSFSEFDLKMEDSLPRFVPPPEFFTTDEENVDQETQYGKLNENENKSENNNNNNKTETKKEKQDPKTETQMRRISQRNLNRKKEEEEEEEKEKEKKEKELKKEMEKEMEMEKEKNMEEEMEEQEGFDLKMLENLSLKDPKRKRDFQAKPTKQNSLRRLDSTIVESGKDVFKLLVGQLWVITGGASQKFLTPYTVQIANKIGQVFNASENETKNFQSQLKYLLSNSRRTFTEFILELLIGLLSLRYSQDENKPVVSQELFDVLVEIGEINSVKQQTKEQAEKSEELKLKLEKIYQNTFSIQTLLYWFNKRYVDRLTNFFSIKSQRLFCEQHLFYLGKSKFLLSCLLLVPELIKQDGIIKQYSQLINRDYENNLLNLYINNRGKKVKLANQFIRAYGLNNGEYWSMISKDYCEKINFKPETIFDHFPFKSIIKNPSLSNLCQRNIPIKPLEKKKVLTNEKKIKVKINVDWLHKKRLL
ncbi:cysteine and glycine-rich protein 2 binding protein [Anaeramoeba flamelloides]|uniref:Cysteine and glycine-rich protein 2 binding protein n=1 Tax=Anaeramoeba flamelloides TaxID=1746091 RepID=A0ABQ8X9F8_9EUKA|nr:cysteine and glycine-rich protein 2 binding protein [Anaeramoeba flamelloides]